MTNKPNQAPEPVGPVSEQGPGPFGGGVREKSTKGPIGLPPVENPSDPLGYIPGKK